MQPRELVHVTFFKRLLRYWAIAGVVATAMMLFTAFQTHLQFLLRGEEMTYFSTVLWSGVIWYVWALLAPFAAMLAMRHPLEKGRGLGWSFALQIAFGAIFIGLHATIAGWIMHWYPERFGISTDLGSGILQLLAMQGHWGVMSYVALIAIVHVVIYFRRAQVEALAREELRTQAASAQLMALAQQMQPHFLFNALNALVAMQPEGSVAQIFTIRLADMLRILLHGGERATTTLGEELDLVDAYLQIERARLGTRLRTDIDIAPALIRCRLPAFILQPLVENAITHGIARTASGGEIRLRAWRDADAVVIDVSNSCDASLAGPEPSDGSQLTIPNSRRRLALLYGPEARFEAGFVTRNLFRASIILPGDASVMLQPA
jgi:two-component system LytT family sensor kinase